MEVGVNLFVKEIELCGGHQEQSQDNSEKKAENKEQNKDLPF